MKQIVFKILLAGLVLSSFASCSNDDDPTIDFVEGTDTALVTGYEPGKFTIPVLGKGEWEATVVPEDADWIALPQTKGEGSGQVVFLVEANTTEELRKAQIVLKAGKKTLTYDVTQTTLVEEEALNGAGIDYSKFGDNIPIGYGVMIKGKKNINTMVTSQIFCVEYLGDNALKGQLKGNYVQTADISVDKKVFQTDKDFKKKEREVKANLAVNVQYMKFKLGLEGHFKMSGVSKDTTYYFNASCDMPVQNVRLNYNGLRDFCDKMQKVDSLKGLRYYVMTESFLNIRDSIQTLVKANAKIGDEDLDEQLKTLNNNYGPVFCSSAVLGGNTNISVSLAKSVGADTLNVSGKLKTTFSSLFSLDVEADASYLNQDSSYIESSTLSIEIAGGSKVARDSLQRSLVEVVKPSTSTDEVNKILLNKISDWTYSINPNDSKTYTCTDYSLIGIWELFTDKASQNVVMEYMTKKYKNKKDDKGVSYSPYIVDIEEMVKDFKDDDDDDDDD